MPETLVGGDSGSSFGLGIIKGGEKSEKTSILNSLSTPGIPASQHQSKTASSLPVTAVSLPPTSSTRTTSSNQSELQNKLLQAQTKNQGGHETTRRSNDSLLWHSVNSQNSSCSLSEEEGPLRSADAVPPHSIVIRPNPKIISIVNNQRRSEPTRKLSPTEPNPRGHHSASALGFGGPSDWEHFGDYDAEEIDDTDLYISKPEIAIKLADKAAELPVDMTPTDEHQSLKKSEQVGSDQDAKADSESHEPEHGFGVSEDDKSKTSGTESRAKPRVSDSTLSQSSKTKSETAFSQRESPEMDRVVKVMSGDFDASKSQEYQVSSSLDLGEPSSDHSVKLSGEIQIEEPSGDRTSLDQPLDPSHPCQDEVLLTTPSSDETEALSVAEETATMHQKPCVQTPTHRDLVSDDGRVTSMIDETLSEEKQFEIIDDVSNDSSISRQSDVEVSSTINEHPSKPGQIRTSKEFSMDESIVRQINPQASSIISQTTSEIEQIEPTQVLPLDESTSQENGCKWPSVINGSPAKLIQIETSQELMEERSISQKSDESNPYMIDEDFPTNKQIESSEELSKDGPLSQESDSVTSSDGPKADLPGETREKISTNIVLESSSSIMTDNNLDSLAQSSGDVTIHQISRLEDVNPPQKNEVNEMCAGLDPWGKASLHRYIAMLREESNAKTEEEKFKVFTVFANREIKLRAVLYAADDDAAMMEINLKGNTLKAAADPSMKHSEKALPALPPEDNPVSDRLEERSTQHTFTESEPTILHEDVKFLLRIDSPPVEAQDGAEENSLLSQDTRDVNLANPTLELKSPRERVNKVWNQFANYIYPAQSSIPEVPKSAAPETLAGPPKPTYIPFKYNETEAEHINYLSKRQSAYRPYAALTMSSLDSGPHLAAEPDDKNGNAERPSYLNIQEGNPQGNHSSEPTTGIPEVVSLDLSDQTTDNSDRRRFVQSDFDPLNSVLPSSGVIIQDSAELEELHKSVDSFPDDFSFIRQSVIAWDAIAKKERERFEKERHIRQGESERKIDELFNDNEIGYGDISELEVEFRRSEASRKADEDRYEYHTFLTSVFDVVWTQLYYEIDHLTPLYDKYTNSIHHSLAGKDMFEVSSAQCTLAPLMGVLLAVHQKLEVRHQKAFEAVLERDRRLKKTELSAWYTVGNVSKVKELEKKFECAEKDSLVAYCQHRDERANMLMDVLDHNTLRGVGANQDYMESLLKAMRRVASGRGFTSRPSSDSDIGFDEVKKAQSITTALSASSEHIVRTFHVADMLLNAADYELSVAKAKLASADAGEFRRLKEERTKEDQKLMRDLEHRLALIREDTRKTQDEVAKLLAFLGIDIEHAEDLGAGPDTTVRSGLEERVQEALDNAQQLSVPKRPEG